MKFIVTQICIYVIVTWLEAVWELNILAIFVVHMMATFSHKCAFGLVYIKTAQIAADEKLMHNSDIFITWWNVPPHNQALCLRP